MFAALHGVRITTIEVVMPIDAEQRDALRLELLMRANERDRWINDYYRGLDAELERARTRVHDCNSYTDLQEWEKRSITPDMWAARKVVRKVYNNGAIIPGLFT